MRGAYSKSIMFGQPVARRLAQQTRTISRLYNPASSPLLHASRRSARRWQHSGATATNSEGAATASNSANTEQAAQAISFADNGKGNVAFASGKIRSPQHSEEYKHESLADMATMRRQFEWRRWTGTAKRPLLRHVRARF